MMPGIQRTAYADVARFFRKRCKPGDRAPHPSKLFGKGPDDPIVYDEESDRRSWDAFNLFFSEPGYRPGYATT